MSEMYMDEEERRRRLLERLLGLAGSRADRSGAIGRSFGRGVRGGPPINLAGLLGGRGRGRGLGYGGLGGQFFGRELNPFDFTPPSPGEPSEEGPHMPPPPGYIPPPPHIAPPPPGRANIPPWFRPSRRPPGTQFIRPE